VTEPQRRALRLEYLTVAWNVMEVFVTVTLGILAGSLALIAFGLDSCIEIFASVVVLWHLRGEGTDHRTRRAMSFVGAAFFLLAAVLSVGAVHGLVTGNRADSSPFGIAYLAVTVVVMFTLSWRKRVVSRSLANHPLEHEARITFLDGILATGILLALVANTAFGWWWADPVAALIVAIAAVPEGLDALRDGRAPDAPGTETPDPPAAPDPASFTH
jgi:divalent metal cation (Fe/Co/Zn/Cd) transporter